MFEYVREKLQEIIEISESCPERYRDKCFELLLRALIQHVQHPTQAPLPQPVGEKSAEIPSLFDKFLKDYDLLTKDIERLIDLDSGEILARALPKQKSEKQRALAALVSIRHAYKNGEFFIPREELIEECKKFGIYDQTNFSKHMKRTKFAGSAVFIKEGDDWKVSRPGEGWIAETIKKLSGQEPV
ncbi:MAG TPA: hypothetical protein ENG73_03145 [Desulfobacterales bacterium]|nr:hypothetical protein [Desulfobacterales bacterium]